MKIKAIAIEVELNERTGQRVRFGSKVIEGETPEQTLARITAEAQHAIAQKYGKPE